MPVLGYKFVVEHIFHVSGKEDCIVNAVACRIHLGIFDSFGNVFNTYNFSRTAAYKVCYRARAGVEVV